MDLHLPLSLIVWVRRQAGRKCDCQELCRSNLEMGLSYEPDVELAGKVVSSCECVVRKGEKKESKRA